MLTSVAAALRRRAVVLSSAAPTFLGAGSSISTAAASRHIAAPSAIAAHSSNSWSSARAATLSVVCSGVGSSVAVVAELTPRWVGVVCVDLFVLTLAAATTEALPQH